MRWLGIAGDTGQPDGHAHCRADAGTGPAPTATQTSAPTATATAAPTAVPTATKFTISGRVTDAATGMPVEKTLIYVWKPDPDCCNVIGGSSSPGYISGGVSAADGTWSVALPPGNYKLRASPSTLKPGSTTTNPVFAYSPQFYRNRESFGPQTCLVAEIINVDANITGLDFVLQPE